MTSLQTMWDERQQIFISYAHADKDVVVPFAHQLAEAGFRIWIDEELLEVGHNYNVDINAAMKDSSLFLAFLSHTYVQKEYCRYEFDLSIDNSLWKIGVCVDDVTRETPGSDHILNRYSGQTLSAYGIGIRDDEARRVAFEKLCDSSVMRYTLLTNAEREYIPLHLTAEQSLIDHLRYCIDQELKLSTDYLHTSLKAELFPQLKQISTPEADGNPLHIPLYDYIHSHPKEHVLLVGEGGMGKTVSMQQTCLSLLQQGVPALYLPLRSVDLEYYAFEQYLEKVICASQDYWRDFEVQAKTLYEDQPNMVLLLDGLNELNTFTVQGLLRNINRLRTRWRGTQFVFSSRYDLSLEQNISEWVYVLTLEHLQIDKVNTYLNDSKLPPVTNERLLTLLQNPLLLTLYVDTETSKRCYEQIPGISVFDEPDSSGKIIHNYLQTQLYRAAAEKKELLAGHFVALEYVLPLISIHMVQQHKYGLFYREIKQLLRKAGDRSNRYIWYEDSRLDELLNKHRIYNYQWDDRQLMGLLQHELHFLVQSDNGQMELWHPIFRDYFAACYLSNEMRYLLDSNVQVQEELALTHQSYPMDIIELVADVTCEELARPRLEDGSIIFPGKKDMYTPSEFSLSEQTLLLFRNQEGEAAQNAICNLLGVMCFGRNRLLAYCDYSNLDLRGCEMNGCWFSMFYGEHLYTSCFDGAWMDRSFLVSGGHEDVITAVCADENQRCFSGDHSGVIKVYDFRKQRWITSIQPQNTEVIDLCWNESVQRLGILYADAVYIYEPASERLIEICRNNLFAKKYRYLQFTRGGDIQVSYDVEPLIWYTTDGQRLTSDLIEDVPVHCACWHPARRAFIRSYLCQEIDVMEWCEERGAWEQHAELCKLNQRHTLAMQRAGKQVRRKLHMRVEVGRLDKENTKDDDYLSIRCLSFHPSGKRFLVSVGTYIIEYDYESLAVLQKKQLHGNIRSVCYMSNGLILVGASDSLILLSSENMVECGRANHGSTDSIQSWSISPDGTNYFLISTSYSEIKQLDHNLRVQRIRVQSVIPGSFRWCRDRKTNQIQMLFTRTKQYPYGGRYHFQTNTLIPLGWCYEVLDISSAYCSETQRVSRAGDFMRLVATAQETPYDATYYVNYSGVRIFGCSFRHLRGAMSTAENQAFLYQNGGEINE